MGYSRKSFFDLDIVNVDNKLILQNEISLARWILDAFTLLFTIGESYNLKKKILIKEFGFSYIPTIYLEKGCNAINIVGRTIIEFKYNLLYDTEIRESEIYKYIKDGSLVDNLLVVYINDNNYSPSNLNIRGRITLKKAEDFVSQIKKALEKGKGVVNSKIRENEFAFKDWHENRDDIMIKAVNDFNQFDSVLFLGAGVSASAEVPNWDKLLKNILYSKGLFMADDYDEALKKMGYSNLIMARYIRKTANMDKKELVECIRTQLYSDSKKSSRLISAICAMVKKQKKVRSIITYNYDTLIEEKLNSINLRCFPVYKKNHSDTAAFPVYHVHGIIFREQNSDITENIVLSEEEYHDKYSHVFDWSNVEQLHALTRNKCFFIGLSMKDPNLRRLLEIAKEGSGNGMRHYVFLERESFSNDSNKNERDFITRENLLADLGLNVIWYEGGNNHQELPCLLKKFYDKRIN